MTRNIKDFTPDIGLLMKDAGLVAASAAAQVSSADKILNLGAGRVDGRVIVDITAIETGTGDEEYQILIQGSDSASFGGTTHKNLGCIHVGDSTKSLEGVDSPVGRRELAFTNELNGHVFQYARLYTRVQGTIATGINYTGWAVLKV